MPIATHFQVLTVVNVSFQAATAPLAIPPGSRFRLLVAVTAVTGTNPSMTVQLRFNTIQGSVRNLASQTFTAPGTFSVLIENAPQSIRLRRTISGILPNFTYNVDIVLEQPTEVSLHHA